MYTITRQEAADILGVSTRSIDRYVRARKLRSKKDGKIIYIHKEDIENLSGEGVNNQEIIVPTKQQWYTQNERYQSQENYTNTEKSVSVESHAQTRAIEKIYIDLRSEIQKKDTLIQDLSLQLGQAREIARNSVSLMDFKKSQFLLEESKTHLSQEMNHIEEDNQKLKKALRDEKGTNYILIGIVIVLLIIFAVLWFSQV
jgi:excisionase family DNA binding protein